MNILFVGGSSIGHVAPCVAVWREVLKKDPSATAHFICSTKREDAIFLEKEKVSFTELPIPTLSLSFPVTLWKTYTKASGVMDTFRPDVVFSKGGALSVPVCLATKRKNIPIILHESDVVGGRANRIVSKWADTICLGFPPTTYNLQPSHSVITGNPVRPEISRGSKEEGGRITGLRGEKPVLLILGGSQGAKAINEIVTELLPELLSMVEIIHLTGKGKKTPTEKIPGYDAVEFAHEELPHLYAFASVALSRSGAGSISELAANRIPTILVPLRGVAQDHQEANARAIERRGGCIVLEQEDMKEHLTETLRTLLSDTTKMDGLAENLFRASPANAAGAIAEILLASGSRK